jgi:hypothetical protein
VRRFEKSFLISLANVIGRYAAMVAAGCMVLYGFDAAIFNNVQVNKQWLAWFNNPVSAWGIFGEIILTCPDSLGNYLA